MGDGIITKIKKFFTVEDFDMDEEEISDEEEEFEEAQPSRIRKRGNVISFPKPDQQNIVIMEPMDLNEARDVADNLKCSKPIIVNLQKVEKDMARRVIDFISGITYALDGHVQKIQEDIFLFTPTNIEIVPPSKKEQKELQEKFFLK